MIREHLVWPACSRCQDANPGGLRGLAALLGHASLNAVMVYTEPRPEDRPERVG